MIGVFPNVQNSKLHLDANSETSVFTNTLLEMLLLQKKSATFAVHTMANDERQMQSQKMQSDDKTQVRVRLHHLANRYCL